MISRKERRPRGRLGVSSENGLAFSTGQAARYCYVTADTILNWINAGSLRAHRTAGGQYRIVSTDLLSFMREHGMRTDLLEGEVEVRPHCWEFLCSGETDPGCLACMAYRSGAVDCFELRDVIPPETRLIPRCAECDYFRRYAGADDQEE